MSCGAIRSPRPSPVWMALTLTALMLLAACTRFSSTEPVPFDHTYPAWNTLLARTVQPAGPDYAALKEHPLYLVETITNMERIDSRTFAGWPPETRLAFLINAHNAFAIQRIVKHYPVASMQATQWLGSALDDPSIELIGRHWSLRQLQETIMSPEYHEVRAIFLLNWGAAGCAPLAPAAVTPLNLRDLLESQPRRFLADERYCQYDQIQHTIYVSELIERYAKEIEREFTTLWIFLERYLPADQAAGMRKHAPRIRILPFDDSLNDANLPPVVRLESSIR